MHWSAATFRLTSAFARRYRELIDSAAVMSEGLTKRYVGEKDRREDGERSGSETTTSDSESDNEDGLPLRPFREVVPMRTLPVMLLDALRSAVPRREGMQLLPWLKTYSRHKFFRDLMAACVVATVLVPQSMSYALLAGVDPVYGLYSAVLPMFTYGLLTSSSSIATGPVAPTAILMSGMIHDFTGAEERSAVFTRAMLQLTFASGLVLTAMVLLRLGWVADMLSFPVISGYTSGAACIIIASQLSDLFGIPVPKERDFFKRLQRAGENALRANQASAATGAVCLIVLLYAKDVKIAGRQLPKLTPIPLIVLVIMTGVSYAMDLQAMGVKVVGDIPSVLPSPSFPFTGSSAGSDLAKILPSAILLSVVSYVQTLSVGSVFAQKKGEKLSAPREMMACALTNVVGGCFQCIQVSGSFTRTSVQYGAGAETPACGMFVGVIMIVAILTLTRVLKYLPMCVLAAVVVSSTRSLLDFSEAAALWAGKPTDFLQLLVTFIAVLALELQNGLFAGIGFSLLLVLYRSFQPRLEELARLPNTDTYVALSRYPDAIKSPGVLILRMDGEISFGNVRKLSDTLLDRLARHTAALALVASGSTGSGGATTASAGTSPRVEVALEHHVSGGAHDGYDASGGAAAAEGDAGGGRSGRNGSIDNSKQLHTRTRTVYALAIIQEGKDRIASMLAGEGLNTPTAAADGDDDGIHHHHHRGKKGKGHTRSRKGSAVDTNADDVSAATGALTPAFAQNVRSRHGGRRGGGDVSISDNGVATYLAGADDEEGKSLDAASINLSSPELASLPGSETASNSSTASASGVNGSGTSAGAFAPAPAAPAGDAAVGRAIGRVVARPAPLPPLHAASAAAASAAVVVTSSHALPSMARWRQSHPDILRAVILDCSRIVDIDATGCRELKDALDAFERARVPLILAAIPGPVRDTMTAFGIDKHDREGDKKKAAGSAGASGNHGGVAGMLSRLVPHRKGASAAAAAASGGTAAAAEPVTPPVPGGVASTSSSAAAVVSPAEAGSAAVTVAIPQQQQRHHHHHHHHHSHSHSQPILCDGARRAILRSLATRYLSIPAAVAAVEAAYDRQASALVAACASSGVTHWCNDKEHSYGLPSGQIS